ncbi:MAG: DNA-3-methyladenine glycosylase I [Pseudomonadota bacterium]
MQRCDWCGDDSLYIDYHDREWGVPLRDEQRMFEFLSLEGAQAGLSWITILRKREGYRAAFAEFDVHKVAAFTDRQLEKCLKDERIVRNRLKVYSVRKNALAVLNLYEQDQTLTGFLWDFVDGKPIQNQFRTMDEVPASTPLSHQVSKALKARGFTFVGPTIVYALMQATGMVNDHLVTCPRHAECAALA